MHSFITYAPGVVGLWVFLLAMITDCENFRSKVFFKLVPAVYGLALMATTYTMAMGLYCQ